MKKARHLLICLAVVMAMVFTSFASFAAIGSEKKPVTGNKSAVEKEFVKAQWSSKDKAKLEAFMKNKGEASSRMGIASYDDPIIDEEGYIKIFYPEPYDEYCIGNSMNIEASVYDTWSDASTMPVTAVYDSNDKLIDFVEGGIAGANRWTSYSGAIYFDPAKYIPGRYVFAIINVPCHEDGTPLKNWTEMDVPIAAMFIDLVNHSFSPWNVIRNATEADPGVKSHYCYNCGRTFTASIAQLSPTLPKVSIKKPKGGKKMMTVKWKKVSKKNQKKIAKIEVQFSQDRNFKSGVYHGFAKKSKSSVKVKKLAPKKTYYVRIRAYKVSGGAVHVSAWSKVKAVKVK